jgi:acetate CoA/acetoacetate CoA-transferase alpha subunit
VRQAGLLGAAAAHEATGSKLRTSVRERHPTIDETEKTLAVLTQLIAEDHPHRRERVGHFTTIAGRAQWLSRPEGKEVRFSMRTISLEQSVAMIPNGSSLMIGGFMAVGTPERIIDEILRQKKRDLTVIANDTAMPGRGIGKLVGAKSLRKVIVSHIGLNPETQKQMMAGDLEVELVPQGTLIERIRAGGFGLGGILTQTGLGTSVEDGKKIVEVDGRSYLVEAALHADFALVQAFLADYLGNLSYALTARNFNPVIAMAGRTVIVAADNIVPVGVMSPDHVVTPAPLVDYLVANL